MPRYFFHMTKGEFLPDLDFEGVELADLVAARNAAVEIAAERLRGSGEEFWQAGHWRVEISDENGMIVGALFVNTATAAVDPVTNEPGRGVSTSD